MQRILKCTTLLLICGGEPAFAACAPRGIGETPASMAEAEHARIKRLVPGGLMQISGEQGQRQYMVGGKADVMLFIDPFPGDPTNMTGEIGVATDWKPKNEEVAITLIAYALSRVSDVGEQTLKDDIYTGIKKHQAGSAAFKLSWGSSVAFVTPSTDGLIIKAAKVDCD